jgi:glycosyltransferase involved in cell wall biosynthesis
MRILIANSNRNLVGGIEKYLHAVLPALLAHGHEVGILHEMPLSRDREVIDPPELDLPSWNVSELGPAAALRAVDEWKPDVIYAHGLASAELEGYLLRIYPTVLFAHTYYGTCGTGHKCHSFPQVRPCSRKFGPMCVLLHYPRRCGGLNPLTTLRVFQRQAQRKAGLPLYAAILTASESMHREYLKYALDPEKVHLVPLPAFERDSDTVPPGNRVPRGRILFAGRLAKLKGAHYLIRAVAQARSRFSPLVLTIAGDGPEREELESLARKLEVPTEFTGWVYTDQRKALMGQSDLLAVPSLLPEPFGLVGLEAASIGVPSVGYAVGGIPDWLIPGYSGELAPADPPTVPGLAEAILRALTDRNHYSTLCRGAWEVASRFTLEAHVQKLMPILSAGKPETILSVLEER